MAKKKSIAVYVLILLLGGLLGYQIYQKGIHFFYEREVLKQIISRLEADSRVAEVLVTGVNYNEVDRKTYTTIKFLEYDSAGRPLEPKYFSFAGNVIQFQSLVVRFDDRFVRQGDRFKGKSAYLFWKVFMLDGPNTQEYDITPMHQVPRGYRLAHNEDPIETEFWNQFWEYALDPEQSKMEGIRNAQIEAPGTLFMPGLLYTIKIEHDGGLRIDAQPLAPILAGEKIPA